MMMIMMMMKGEPKVMQHNMYMAYFKVIFYNSPESTTQSHENLKLHGVSSKARTN